ncbi:MAG TPA: hypothetical protein DC000_07290 [Clostridiales bacterium]|nr:hypothetical protein [Clostridiales bacterium]
MPSVNKTPTLGLNQWEGNEYFKREDLVNDNALIDAAIKQDRETLEDKADKAITIGGSKNIRLIGEITNYVASNRFVLEAMLHNMYLKNTSQLSNAFLILGKSYNEYPIEGKMHLLYDNQASNHYITKIQITNKGKIYAINSEYMENTSWNIINKSNNVIIYNDPQVVSTIDGSVIWDSELNKTNLATTDKIDNLFESGIWTPNLRGLNNDGTITYTTREGKYYKTNKLMKCSFFIRATVTGMTGDRM